MIKTTLEVYKKEVPKDIRMIIPVINMDITPVIQLLIVVSYIGLLYVLTMEIVKDNPFTSSQKKLSEDVVTVTEARSVKVVKPKKAEESEGGNKVILMKETG